MPYLTKFWERTSLISTIELRAKNFVYFFLAVFLTGFLVVLAGAFFVVFFAVFFTVFFAFFCVMVSLQQIR